MKKMVMAIVPRDEAEFVLDALINAGHTATFTETRGGMLRQSQLSLFIAVDEEHLGAVKDIIRESCRIEVQVGISHQANNRSLGPIPVTAGLGGAIVFVWDLDSLETY